MEILHYLKNVVEVVEDRFSVDKLLLDPDILALKPASFKVFVFIALLGGETSLTSRSIAEKLSCATITVNKAIEDLLEQGLVIEVITGRREKRFAIKLSEDQANE